MKSKNLKTLFITTLLIFLLFPINSVSAPVGTTTYDFGGTVGQNPTGWIVTKEWSSVLEVASEALSLHSVS